MPTDNRNLLDVLKFELEFLEQGGYGRLPRESWRPRFVFEDSPTCMNFNSKDREPCSECLLMQFVPEEARKEQVPCIHIPLVYEGRDSRQFVSHRNPAGGRGSARQLAPNHNPPARSGKREAGVICQLASLIHSEIDIAQDEQASENPHQRVDVANFARRNLHYRIGDQTKAQAGGDAEGQRAWPEW